MAIIAAASPRFEADAAYMPKPTPNTRPNPPPGSSQGFTYARATFEQIVEDALSLG